MTYSHSKVEIRLDSEFGPNCIYFAFKDKFTQEASEQATKYWCDFFESNPQLAYSFVWDCSQMSGFEPAARKIWYESMKKYKSRISNVTIISPNILIRGAARVMMEVFGVKSRIVKSIEEIKTLA